MNRRTFAALCVVCLALPLMGGSSRAQPKPGTAASALSANDIVDRVQNVYATVTTFKASFKQHYAIRAHNKVKVEAGRVFFEKPGKMSWRYTSNGNRVVSDGKVIKILQDAQQNRNAFDFSGQVVNTKPPPDEFVFTPPPGTAISRP